MEPTPNRRIVTGSALPKASHLRDISAPEVGRDRSFELLGRAESPSRVDDAMAVGVAALLAVGGAFISWVLLAPGALDFLK